MSEQKAREAICRINNRLAVLIRRRLAYDRMPPWFQQVNSRVMAGLDRDIKLLQEEQRRAREAAKEPCLL